MLIPDETIERMLPYLQLVDDFQDLPVRNRPPMPLLWKILDTCLQELRLPLYSIRLGKKPPSPKDAARAIQRALALLTVFAHAVGTRQAIVSIVDGWPQRISFQPRPFGLNWTADHAVDPVAIPSRWHEAPVFYEVSIEDMLHLAPKIAFAVSETNIGRPLNAVATFLFERVPGLATDLDHLLSWVTVRPRDGRDWTAHWTC
jgi:hypothetical protein